MWPAAAVCVLELSHWRMWRFTIRATLSQHSNYYGDVNTRLLTPGPTGLTSHRSSLSSPWWILQASRILPSVPEGTKLLHQQLHLWTTSCILHSSLAGISDQLYLGNCSSGRKTEQRCPFRPACAEVSCVQTMAWVPVFVVFNMQYFPVSRQCLWSVFPCVQTMAWVPVFVVFNMRINVAACDCTQGLCRPRKRVCTESWVGEKEEKKTRRVMVSNPRLAMWCGILPATPFRPNIMLTCTPTVWPRLRLTTSHPSSPSSSGCVFAANTHCSPAGIQPLYKCTTANIVVT